MLVVPNGSGHERSWVNWSDDLSDYNDGSEAFVGHTVPDKAGSVMKILWSVIPY